MHFFFSTFLHTLQMVAITIAIYMVVWFVIGMLKRRNDVADIAWGLGFIVAALVPIVVYGFNLDRSLIVTLLVCVWGLRLAYHITARFIKKSEEDPRYKAWRIEWGNWFVIRSFFQVYILQGILLILVSLPVLVINTYRGGELGFLDILGLCIWTLGFYFEARSDRELRDFIKNPENKGKVLDTGLWKYSRHPNYFGEVTGWWGIGIIALSVPYGFVGLIGPITITILILKVSGIPLLEKRMMENPLFREYAERTSVFIPLPPKK